MDCPACKGVMVIVEYERIELDYCTECAGVWFDYGELDLLLERLDLDNSAFDMETIMGFPDKQTKETVRKCPSCRKKMRKVMIGSDPEVMVDVCPGGEGIWFDGGEVHQIIKQLVDRAPGGAGGEEKVISFLGEVFKASGE